MIVGLAAVIIGITAALVLKGFEFAVNDGTQWLWNDVLRSDENRWLVLPLTVGLGTIFACILRWLRLEPLPEPKLDLMAPEPPRPRATLGSMARDLLAGWSGLFAGASLGPEAPLMQFADQSGEYAGRKIGLPKPAIKILSIASIGALLVSFLGSLVMLLLPILQIARTKQPLQNKLAAVLIILIAGLAAFGTLWLINPSVVGWGSLPVIPTYQHIDWILAFVVGLLAAGFGWLLKMTITKFYTHVTVPLHRKLPWVVSAALFGLILGLVYLIGGPTIQFNGSAGSHELVQHASDFGAGALLVIVLAKLAATAWSTAAGYRGGLVFPSIYSGVTIFLLVEVLFDVSSAGILLGSIAGILGAMTGPVPAGIFVLALIPVHLMPIAIVGILGAWAGNRLLAHINTDSHATVTP